MKIFTNGTEWWIARDLEHLRALFLEASDLQLEDDDALGDDGKWSEWPENISLGMMTGEDGGPPRVELTPAQWVAREPPGFLCSIEA